MLTHFQLGRIRLGFFAALGLILASLPVMLMNQPIQNIGKGSVSKARSEALLPYVKPLEMIRRSDLVIEGTVTAATDGIWNQSRTMLYTDYTVDITKTLKGTHPGSSVIIRNPGGTDVSQTGEYVKLGEAPEINVGDSLLLLLTTENLPYLDMSYGAQYYVSFWVAGVYDIRNGLAIHRVHPDFNEPLVNFEARAAALNLGLPDPYPLPGRPIYDSSSGGPLP